MPSRCLVKHVAGHRAGGVRRQWEGVRLLLPLLMLATVAQSDNPNHSDNSSSTSGEQKYNNYKRERSAQGGGVRQLGWAHTKYPASGKRKRKWRIQQSRTEPQQESSERSSRSRWSGNRRRRRRRNRSSNSSWECMSLVIHTNSEAGELSPPRTAPHRLVLPRVLTMSAFLAWRVLKMKTGLDNRTAGQGEPGRRGRGPG